MTTSLEVTVHQEASVQQDQRPTGNSLLSPGPRTARSEGRAPACLRCAYLRGGGGGLSGGYGGDCGARNPASGGPREERGTAAARTRPDPARRDRELRPRARPGHRLVPARVRVPLCRVCPGTGGGAEASSSCACAGTRVRTARARRSAGNPVGPKHPGRGAAECSGPDVPQHDFSTSSLPNSQSLKITSMKVEKEDVMHIN
ncbi:uncharacterized protein LOC123812904 [Phyllostomus hastatus]|uniref:uncharacterized protein LOC123812904 n=1 Tax=Phyllostomus hastatus TaxID=9423 RepID=UPI001E682EA1|nr:uncharacterized protein LOC123812904 [Phyllostomus hastatus]